MVSENVETGIITGIIDCGSIVQVLIHTEDGLSVLAADGNMFRRAEAECGRLGGVHVEFMQNGWGGLEWFAPLETEEY
ncbi:MAG: hypothetical protein IVW36_07565 [Dehalococcoidia bacterium]|nr:hypothetical protein [Dehalococcoidia bacterium]